MNSKKMIMLIACIFVVASVPYLLTAQETSSATSDEQKMSMCHQMMSKHQEMKSKMKEMNQQLEQKVSALDAAAGEEEKLNAVIAVVKELASQHQAMHEHMENMPQQMTSHMGEHIEHSNMSACPMMKGGMMQADRMDSQSPDRD